MKWPSQVLAQVSDEHGLIRVSEEGDFRYLEFGAEVEQSCSLIGQPSWLEYDYARAMLLGALCHQSPRSALFLGLGGGSLTQACLQYLPLERAQVIELRPEVVRLAREFFGLTDDPRLTIRIGDALQVLPGLEGADLVFVDLYTDSGPGAGHFALNFLSACKQLLNPEGWLIINQWADAQGKPMGAGLFRRLYDRHYWECPVSEGNVILWVPADASLGMDSKWLLRRCRQLEADLGYSLVPLLKAIRPPSG